MAWDPGQYLKFGDERTRPAFDLLGRVPVEKPSHVVDLGCGPGNSTALLAARWPSANIEGIDSSVEMIAKAQDSGVRARFSVADFETWTPDAPSDVIFSNAAIHWAPDSVALAVRLFGMLAPGGALAVQIPQNFDRPSHTLLHALARDPRWMARLQGARQIDPDTFPRAPEFVRALGGDVDAWTTDYLHILRGADPVFNWVSGSALRPFLDLLDDADRIAFEADLKRQYLAAYPPEPDGSTLFPFRRLFVVARRG